MIRFSVLAPNSTGSTRFGGSSFAEGGMRKMLVFSNEHVTQQTQDKKNGGFCASGVSGRRIAMGA